MDDVQTMFTKGQEQFGARVAAISGRWDAPTPDSEWNVAALVDHLVDEQRWVSPLLNGHDLDAAGEIVKGMASTRRDAELGSDLAAEWQDASIAARDAVLEPGALERMVTLSRGPTPARAYLSEMVFDLTVHAWDLGTAIGFENTLPDDPVEWVYAAVSQYGDLSASGLFDKPVDVPHGAPTLDKLIAATGRRPR
jgi:uncharacterized protein (TIGR03086 family)